MDLLLLVNAMEFTPEDEAEASSLESLLFIFRCRDRVRLISAPAQVGSVVRINPGGMLLVAWDAIAVVQTMSKKLVAFVDRPRRKRPTVGDRVRAVFVPEGAKTKLVARDGVVANYMKTKSDDRKPWGVRFDDGRKVYFFAETELILMNPNREKRDADRP